MASLGGDTSQAEGAKDRHVPVLISEVIEALKPEAGKVIVDGTFGAGGYTRRILEQGADVIAIDRDPTAITAGQTMEKLFSGRLNLVENRFSALDQAVERYWAKTGKWTASCSISVSRRCRSMKPSAAFPSRRMDHWTCACQ